MRKQRIQTPNNTQMTEARLEVNSVDNYALREAVRIVNWGAQAQPLDGWALASARSGDIFFFPSNLTIKPQAAITVHSGAGAHAASPTDLFWTNKQVWNNDGDMAVLFDPNGNEADRYIYPDEWRLEALTHHRKRLLQEGITWRIIDEERSSHDAFVRRVQAHAGLDSQQDAAHLTEIVLATFGERLYRTEQKQLGAQLVPELRQALAAQQAPEQTRKAVQYFSLEEFYRRVSARLGIGYPAAIKQTKAVMVVLQETVPASVAAVWAKLPAEFGALFQSA